MTRTTRMMKQVLAEIAVMDRQRTVEEAKRVERHVRRVGKGTQAKPRVPCTCGWYPFPHRRGGGACRWPEPAPENSRFRQGHAPNLLRTGKHGARRIRRRILDAYGWHRIKDRKLIERWLPKLHVAYCRRIGHIDGFWDPATGQPIPAMRITATSRPTSYVSWEVAHARRTDFYPRSGCGRLYRKRQAKKAAASA
jgi:hypothetical protein